jgi:hypothetical protein
MILLEERLRFWSDQRVPMPYVAALSSMIMIFGGDKEVIDRARATWRGVFVPRQSFNTASHMQKSY